MIIVSGIRLPLGSTKEDAEREALKRVGHPGDYTLRRVSYDMRRGQATMVCSVTASLGDAEAEKRIASSAKEMQYSEMQQLRPRHGTERMNYRPVVVGAGPAGLFAAYLLSEYGYMPILLERGADVDTRTAKVDSFFLSGDLDADTNIQFGEGGAGTFSDGKLTTRINDGLCDYVLNTFCFFGAPDDILTKAKPHIGTDNLRGIIKRIREKIIENGGEVRFLSRVEDITVEDGRITRVRCAGNDTPVETVVLACGHSARDTYSMLMSHGALITAKPFSVGFRIEHLQEDVDRSLYGRFAGDPRLPKGEYNLSAHVGGRGVYTFCMCPGGTVVAAASESGAIVTNGMSRYLRDGKNANSAVCVSVGPEDFGSSPVRAMDFQRNLERAAYAAAGGGYSAPASDVGSFLDGKKGLRKGRIEPSYPRGVVPFDLEKILGSELSECLRGGLRAFADKMDCFSDSEAVLTGVETRTSAPVRINRDENRQAVGIQGLYPCGEGAGYAGGIVSSAVDGLRTAAAIIEKYCPFRG
ncbi:MAG: NAD(P)-binding protein [Oscillospiraceae bacterium]|nr:NAD(P)-binding protein [Oscillospiraceae bacterium]